MLQIPELLKFHRWNLSNPRQFSSAEFGVGPGEEKLAWELGGRVQGSTSSFDILLPNGDRWEVKSPDKNSTIMTAAAGSVLYSTVRQRVDAVVTVLARFASLAKNFDLVRGERIVSFVDKHAGMILRGELSRGRIFGSESCIGLICAMETLSALAREHFCSVSCCVSVFDKEFNVSGKNVILLAQALGVQITDLGLPRGVLFSEILSHEDFMNPRGFVDELIARLKPSLAFLGLSGVALVSELGYELVPFGAIDDVLEFARIHRGRVCFRTKNRQ